MLLIAAHAYPDLSIESELARLDELAAGCAAPTLDGVLQYLFRDLGFEGNKGDYYDPGNSFLNVVLDRRTGIPISLSVMTIEVGRRLGVPLAGVGMPGHFLLRDRVDPSVYVDPFAGGVVVDQATCERTFHVLHGEQVAFDPRFLDPVGTIDIVGRMLNNLRAIYANASDMESLAWVLRARTRWPGVPSSERGELVGVLAGLGRFAEAAAEVDVLAEAAEGEDAERLAGMATRMRARLN